MKYHAYYLKLLAMMTTEQLDYNLLSERRGPVEDHRTEFLARAYARGQERSRGDGWSWKHATNAFLEGHI